MRANRRQDQEVEHIVLGVIEFGAAFNPTPADPVERWIDEEEMASAERRHEQTFEASLDEMDRRFAGVVSSVPINVMRRAEHAHTPVIAAFPVQKAS